jgi:metal-dependent hydrolase (beta-lactamase superfamily II)
MKKIAIGSLFVAISAVAADITFPELRCWIGLNTCSKSSASESPTSTVKSAGLQAQTHATNNTIENEVTDIQAEADIFFPQEGSEVEQNIMINGWLEKTEQQQSFLIIKAQEFEQLYPQGEIFPDKNGQWEIKGTYPTPGYMYETFIVVTKNPDSAKKLTQHQGKPLGRLPKETDLVSNIIIVERSTKNTAHFEESLEPTIDEEIKEEFEDKIDDEQIKTQNLQASAKISYPEDGTGVGKRVMVSGYLENKTAEQRSFLIIKSQSFGQKLYPQGEILPDENGQWTVKGIYHSPGYHYETFVVITNNPESAEQLENQRNRAYGLKTLPGETEIISEIIVLKRI